MRFRSTTLAVAFGLSWLTACSEGSRPNILMILIDTLRADHLGCYGNTQNLTPFIDELAARGTIFRHAYATSSWTVPSVASLFTSRYPQQHQMVSMDTPLDEAETTLAERLDDLGYWSAAYIGHFRLTPELGLWQGFGRQLLHSSRETPARSLTRAALADIEARCSRSSASSTPCFLYLHYFEPHGPYEPPDDIAARFVSRDQLEVAKAAQQKFVKGNYRELSDEDVRLLGALYDGEVVAIDTELRVLFEGLEQRGFLENTIVVLTADHGEEFREHGGMAHGSALFNETVHVPLIILAPRYLRNHMVEENVSLVDVVPTLFDLTNLSTEARFEGRSLVPLMKQNTRSSLWNLIGGLLRGSSPGPNPDVILQLERSGGEFDLRRHSAGIVRGSHKMLVRRTGEKDVFDLFDDPGEAKPRSEGAAAVQQDLSAALEAAKAELGRRGVATPKHVELDEAAKEKLRALGYENFF